MKKGIVVGVLAVVVLGISGAAFATDVKGITMVSVTAGQFTPGDTMGFPLTISKSGSYKLLENITVPNANTTAILVTTDDVTIDLNGFSILGPCVCTGAGPTLVCSPTGTGVGILAATNLKNIKVYNGTVKGMGNSGISVGQDSIIENVRALSNGLAGILVEEGVVNGCTSSSNNTVGIAVYNGIVTGSTATNNSMHGISLINGIVSGSRAIVNAYHGIEVGNIGTVNGNYASANGWDGIRVTKGTVNGNSAVGNSQYGLELGGLAGYSNNVLSGNTAGNVTGGVQIGDNLCEGILCP